MERGGGGNTHHLPPFLRKVPTQGTLKKEGAHRLSQVLGCSSATGLGFCADWLTLGDTSIPSAISPTTSIPLSSLLFHQHHSQLPILSTLTPQPPPPASADDLATPYTNYTSGYQALLDYVWYDPQRLTVTKQLPQPSHHLLSGFIPSQNFPSDHLAVVYDLAFKPQQAAAAAAAAAGGGSSGSDGPSRHAVGAFSLLPASEDHVGDAVGALQRGEVVALPTDTLYGLAAAAGEGG